MSRKNIAVSDVENYTNTGHYYIQQGLLEHAKNAYEVAFTASRKLKSTLVERSCAFNLGAVNVALFDAEKGLKWLQKAVPPLNERDGGSNGDLFYNLGLAYELLHNTAEALKYYELAYQEYHFPCHDLLMELTVVKKVALLYKRLNKPLQAVKFYQLAASLCTKLENVLQHTLCLSHMGAQLVSCGKYEAAVEAADSAVALCKGLQPGKSLGILYNEVGLIYTQCHSFSRAAYCFEQAVSIFQGSSIVGSKAEAVVLQNLGAVYNSIGDYQKALMFHESAASMHANSNNRGLQGQCFTNLAFAYSQLSDIDTAGECYMHAVQAAKDAKDKKGQWQAMEGLGSVCFNQGKTNKAVIYFRLALRILVDTKDYSNKTEERLLGKITDALHHHVKKKQISGLPASKRVQHDSVQEAGNITSMRASSEKLPQNEESHTIEMKLKKVSREFDGVAHGVGRYSTDDDLSIASSVRTTEQPNNRPSLDQQVSERKRDETDLEKFKRRQKGLLRTQTHNSELEWQREVKQAVSSEHSFSAHCIPGHSGDATLQYVEKLHPVSSSDDSVSSDNTEETPKKLQNREKIKQILKRQDSGHVHQWRDVNGKEDPAETLTGQTLHSTSSEILSHAEDQQSADMSPRSNEFGTSDHLLRYQHRMRRKSMHDEVSSEIVTNSDESEMETADSESDHYYRPSSDIKPPVPVDSPLQTQQLSNTYEEPLPAKHISQSSDEEPGHFGVNYFRPNDHERESVRESSSKGGTGMDGTDPLYQTIRSVKDRNEENKTVESIEREESIKSPELPPRPVKREQLSRGEEEEYLRKYHKEMQQKKLESEENTGLPSKSKSSKRSSKSQMCHIM